jgi:hypothetical protein
MLLALIHWLADSTSLGWLRVFNYLTLRAVLAALTAFFIHKVNFIIFNIEFFYCFIINTRQVACVKTAYIKSVI